MNILEPGSDNHKLLLEVANIVNDFFSKYTCTSYLDTRIYNGYQIKLFVANEIKFEFRIGDDNKLYVRSFRNNDADFVDLPYTRETFRRLMRKLASHLVWYLQQKETEEKNEFQRRDWDYLVQDRRGNQWDGYAFYVDINNVSYSCSHRDGILRIVCGTDLLPDILSKLTGIPETRVAVLPKTEPLSTDGLMAKIDAWLAENT
jgi:hypothetical protein